MDLSRSIFTSRAGTFRAGSGRAETVRAGRAGAGIGGSGRGRTGSGDAFGPVPPGALLGAPDAALATAPSPSPDSDLGSDPSADLSPDLSGRYLPRRGSRVRTSRLQRRRLRRADRRAERHAARHARWARARSVTELTPSPLLDEDLRASLPAAAALLELWDDAATSDTGANATGTNSLVRNDPGTNDTGTGTHSDADLADTAEWRFDDLSTSADAPDTIDLSDRPKLIQHPSTVPAPRVSDDDPLPPAPGPEDAAHQPIDRDGQFQHPAPPAEATEPRTPARPARGHGLADPQLAEPTLAAVLAGVASLAAWATLAPTSIWLPLAVLPAVGLMALLVPGQDLARLVRAILLLGAAAVLPAISSAMTPVTLLIALAAAAMYPLLTRSATAKTITALAVAALLTPLVVEAFRAGPQAFIDSLIDPASGTQTAVRVALTSGIVVVGLVGTSAMATRRMLTANAQGAAEHEQSTNERERPATVRAYDTASQLSSHCIAEQTAGTTVERTADPAAQRAIAPASNDDPADPADHSDDAEDADDDGPANLEIELCHAIRSGAIEACYQPVLALGRGSQDDRIVGAEALPCWVSADGTDVPATRFVALADELGLGNQLGLHLIELALDAQLEWRHEGIGVDQVWVNLSPGQLRDPNLAHEISARLAVRGLSPACLVLEVSAAHLIETELAISSLSMLRSLGVAIALDDFGRSGTSLTSLRSLPISAVKLDQQLAGELGGHDVLAASIAQLCQTLGLRVVANGVETMKQLRGARMIGADAVQGHAIARAMSAQDITNLLSLRLPREFRLNKW